MALTAVRHAELAAPGETPGDDAVRTVLAAEVRRRNEAAEIYENNDPAGSVTRQPSNRVSSRRSGDDRVHGPHPVLPGRSPVVGARSAPQGPITDVG
jgi:hypothetical protein